MVEGPPRGFLVDVWAKFWLPTDLSAVSRALSGRKGPRKPLNDPWVTKCRPKSQPKSPQAALKPHLAYFTTIYIYVCVFLGPELSRLSFGSWVVPSFEGSARHSRPFRHRPKNPAHCKGRQMWFEGRLCVCWSTFGPKFGYHWSFSGFPSSFRPLCGRKRPRKLLNDILVTKFRPKGRPKSTEKHREGP